MNNLDILILVGLIFIVLAGAFIGFYYWKSEVDQCTSNPFIYGAKEIEERHSEVKVYGTLTFLPANGAHQTRFLPRYFDSERVYTRGD